MRMLLGAIALVLVACQAGAGVGATCASTGECASPLVCRFGSCRTDCRSNRDCPAGATCLGSSGAGACSLATDLGCETGVGRTCPSPLVCVADRCASVCTTHADCPTDGACRVSAAGVSFCFDVGSETDAGPIDAAPSDAFSQTPDVGLDAGPCFGRLDCDTDPSDCETEVFSDPMHCGTCTRRCPVRAHAMPACTNGACDIACDPGFLDCDHDPTTGCEIDGATDAANCGTCMRACPGSDPICARGDCYPLPFPSDGHDGVFHATADVVLHAGRYEYVSFTIDPGVTVTTDGDGVLDIRVQGDVTIQGALDASGARGGTLSAGTCVTGGGNSGGGATADVLGVGHAFVNDASCQASGTGGSGGNGGTSTGCGAGGACGGGAGGGRRFGGGGGGGYAGGGGGGNGGTTGSRAGAAGGSVSGEGTGGIAGSGLGVGGGGGDAMIGSPHAGGDAMPLASCGPGGGGGGSIGMAAAIDQAVATTFRAGSGGGGGGGNDCGGGGGGGGGGGAIRIASGTSITIAVTGVVRADGGAGAGVPPGAANRGGGGGGGSGGVIFLSAPTLDVTGMVSARGGAAGSAACAQSHGGSGGLGRIRLSVLVDHCTIAGSWSHTIRAACSTTAPAGAAGIVYIDAYPF